MQVEAALRQGESVRWLSSNPAQQHEAPGRDPSALLHRLQLGQASAASPSGPQVRNVTIRPFTGKLDMIWGPLLWGGTVLSLSGKPDNTCLLLLCISALVRVSAACRVRGDPLLRYFWP